jgi:hypothetical protein
MAIAIGILAIANGVCEPGRAFQDVSYRSNVASSKLLTAFKLGVVDENAGVDDVAASSLASRVVIDIGAVSWSFMGDTA